MLPLMQETNLAEQFNQVCGDLEYLDESVRDITAIGYQEKLKKYLEAVLISDELAGQVRAAFDAYIFLSYRKKDRKYAQDLMHLIHASEQHKVSPDRWVLQCARSSRHPGTSSRHP